MMGLKTAEPSDSLPYDDSGLMLDAVVAGHGIGLVRTVISQDAISNGDLVRLSPLELPFEGYYYYVYQADSTPRMSAVHAFGAWLAEQFRQEFPELG